MLNLSINLNDRFPLSDGIRLECLLKELRRHAYSINDDNESQILESPKTLDSKLTIDKKYITPDQIKISLHHISNERDSYVCFHGSDPVAVDILAEVFFYSLNNNFAFKQQSSR